MKVEVVKDEDARNMYGWRLKSRNGKVICISNEVYVRKSSAERAAENFAQLLVGKARVADATGESA